MVEDKTETIRLVLKLRRSKKIERGCFSFPIGKQKLFISSHQIREF